MASSREILLASSADNSMITAYDASSGVILAHFTGSQSPRKGLTLVANTYIAAAHMSYEPSPSASAAASISLYNWRSSTAAHHLPLPEPVAPIVATPDGLYLFCGGVSGYLHALTLPFSRPIRSFPAHGKPISCCILNSDASLLISGGDDGTMCVFPLIQLLDANAHDFPVNALYNFSAHNSSVTAIANGCGSVIVSSSLDSTIKFWSLAHGATLIRTVCFPCMLWCLVLDSTVSHFYVGGSDGRIYVGVTKVDRRHSTDAQVVASRQEHNGAVTALAMLNEGKNIVSASEDGNVKIWDVERGRVVRSVTNGRENISDILVAKGIRDGGRRALGMGAGGVQHRGPSLGYNSGKEISRPVRELCEMEESLNVVVKDRSRAIDVLEGTIETYQKLLGLLIKEANGDDDTNNQDKGQD
ncbi:Wd repeat-containing protein [Thalictrum thalictroides]|uniref:Wd repeat-containing protein n=1 Tax=Thalictrum thalictroides TaxID=46969 RepID=A0A7J6US08_THATH|nr:Wd repeat-containing protein [Thalictrum thalictroides]